MSNTIQIMRGSAADLATKGALAVGELGLTTDTYRTVIGSGDGNKEFLMFEQFIANSMMIATTAKTPVATAIAASRIIGRKAAGDAGALTGAEIMAILTAQNGADFSMNSHKITALSDGSDAADAVNKGQLDAMSVGLHPLAEADNCAAATTAALPACTYDNGTAGVGATLTGDANGALADQDGITLIDTDRLLVKNQAAPLQNGVYVVTAIGTAGTDFVLTRIDAMDEDDEIAMTFVFVAGGTTLGDTSWVCTNQPEDVDVGTDDITFGIFNSPGDITAGTGLTKTGNTIAISDAELLALAGLTFADQKMIVGDGAGTVAMIDLTTFAQTMLDDADQAGVQATLGVVPGTDVLAQQTIGILDDNLVEVDVTAIDGEIAAWTGNGITSLTDAEVMAALSGGATADFAMNAQKITGVKDPTADQDAATKKWVTDNFAAGAGASAALDNLASVAINTALIPGTAGALDFGSTDKPWADMWFAGTSGTPGTNQFKLTGVSTSGVRTITAPDKSGYMLLTAAANVLDGGAFVP